MAPRTPVCWVSTRCVDREPVPGVGNSYVSTLAPTVKLSANPVAAQRLGEQLDFDASAVFRGEHSIDAAARELLERIVDIASGTLTWGEVLGEGDEVVSRIGEAL